MPQMAPLMWLTLFMIFSSMFLISMIKNYFSTQKKIYIESETKKTINKYLIWKW